ncbi:MAG: hypothetical protein RSD40_00375, partial [Bacilli bacterium]
MKRISILLIYVLSCNSIYSQVVIGSENVSNASILKVDIPNKAIKLPTLSITDKNDNQSPVLNPARGLLFYNVNNMISDNIIDGVSYWGYNNQYQTFTTKKGIEDVIKDSHIPLMIFSSTVGQKSNIACGSGSCSGWTWTSFNPVPSEVFIDSYTAWDINDHMYEIPETETYIIEYSTNISNNANGDGTSNQNLFVNGNSLSFSAG